MSTANDPIHLGLAPDPAVLQSLADFICGDNEARYPIYRSSMFLTRFFQDLGISVEHDGSTRKWWVLETLNQLQPVAIEKVILRLVDLRVYSGDRDQLQLAKQSMDAILAMESLRVGFDKSQPILLRAESLDLNEDFADAAPSSSEHDFLNHDFSDDIAISELGLDAKLTEILQSRVDEVQAAPRDSVALGCIFLIGSTLEGMLLATAMKDHATFMTSPSAPSLKDGTTKKLPKWTLAELIDVSHATGILGQDVKKFSHALRDFRNYIHPYEQMTRQFTPDQNTVDICWHVFKAAYAQLRGPLLGGPIQVQQ